MIRGSLSLPHGVGKTKRVVAFCPEHLVTSALNAGAIKAGGQELVQEIEKEGFTDFDVAVSTPDMMRFVGRLGKVLGPKGLMPSPKAGTVTPDVANAVREYSAGKIEFRNDSGGNVHSVVGKVSFDKWQADRQHQRDDQPHPQAQTPDQQRRFLQESRAEGVDDACGVSERSLIDVSCCCQLRGKPAGLPAGGPETLQPTTDNGQRSIPMSKKVKNLIEKDLRVASRTWTAWPSSIPAGIGARPRPTVIRRKAA